MMRDALAGAVRLAHPGVEIHEAEDFPSAWVAAAARPDLILCDLVMPGATPELGIERLQKAAPETPVLIVTGNEDDALLLRLLRLGIAGVLPKASRSAVIEAAIGLILAGERYLPPHLARMAEPSGRPESNVPHDPRLRLSPRQTEILRAMAQGHSNKEIARRFDLSPATVKAHAAAAFLSLGVSNRTEAAFRAREEGLI